MDDDQDDYGADDGFIDTGAPLSSRCQCEKPEIEVYESGGFSVCKICGVVLEENIIVNSVEFTESSTGRTSVIGQFVGNSAISSRAAATSQYGAPRESKALTLQNGKKSINDLVSKLQCPANFVDMAFRLFHMAVDRNFVQGRKTMIVCAASLYVVCRRQNSSVMLMDFSDALQINVFVLGRVFLKFTHKLNLPIPVVDPSLFIHRFANELGFKDLSHTVETTALRIISRMKRDWMVQGRRPSGICGAALLIAARIHGFNKTQKEIVEVLRICEETLRTRLHEFDATPSGQLAVEDFLVVDLQDECDPPAFTRNKRLEDEARLAIEDLKRNDESFLMVANASDSLALAIAEREIQKKELATQRQKSKRIKQRNAIFDDIEKDLRDALSSIENDGLTEDNSRRLNPQSSASSDFAGLLASSSNFNEEMENLVLPVTQPSSQPTLAEISQSIAASTPATQNGNHHHNSSLPLTQTQGDNNNSSNPSLDTSDNIASASQNNLSLVQLRSNSTDIVPSSLANSRPQYTLQAIKYDNQDIMLSDTEVDVDDLLLPEEESKRKIDVWEKKHKKYIENEQDNYTSSSSKTKTLISKSPTNDGSAGNNKSKKRIKPNEGEPAQRAFKSSRINYDKIPTKAKGS